MPNNAKSAAGKEVLKMVENNDLEGFKESTHALTHLELDRQMGECKPQALFMCGEADGLIPVVMKEFPSKLSNGKGKFVVVKGAGHLPIVPQSFRAAVVNFLANVGE